MVKVLWSPNLFSHFTHEKLRLERICDWSKEGTQQMQCVQPSSFLLSLLCAHTRMCTHTTCTGRLHTPCSLPVSTLTKTICSPETYASSNTAENVSSVISPNLSHLHKTISKANSPASVHVIAWDRTTGDVSHTQGHGYY